MEVDKRIRYTVSCIANFLIAFYFLVLYNVYMVHYPSYSLGFLILAFLFGLKAFIDLAYSEHWAHIKEFHLVSGIYLLFAGLIFIKYEYFGISLSWILGLLAIIMGVADILHYKYEDDIWKFRRHLTSAIFKWFFGSCLFFDSLFYNLVNKSLFGWLYSIYGILAGLYVMYAGLVIYRYAVESTGLSILDIFK